MLLAESVTDGLTHRRFKGSSPRPLSWASWFHGCNEVYWASVEHHFEGRGVQAFSVPFWIWFLFGFYPKRPCERETQPDCHAQTHTKGECICACQSGLVVGERMCEKSPDRHGLKKARCVSSRISLSVTMHALSDSIRSSSSAAKASA